MLKSLTAARAITPSDSADLASPIRPSRSIYVGSGGDLRVKFLDDDNPVTLVGVPGGSLLPLEVTRVYSTGTTASSLVALI